MPPGERVVGDVEILRARPVVLHHAADIVDFRVLQREAAGAGDAFDAQQKRDVGVADRDAFEVLIIAAHQVEQILAAVAVENHLAVARAFDRDGFVGRAALGQVIGAVEDIAHRQISGPGRAVHVMEAVAHVEAGMDQNRVAGLNPGRIGVLVIVMRQAHVVGGHQAGKCRLLLGAGPAHRIDVVNVTALRPAAAPCGCAASTVFSAAPVTPSGSESTKRHSYSVSGSRFRMLPENMLAAV